MTDTNRDSADDNIGTKPNGEREAELSCTSHTALLSLKKVASFLQTNMTRGHVKSLVVARRWCLGLCAHPLALGVTAFVTSVTLADFAAVVDCQRGNAETPLRAPA